MGSSPNSKKDPLLRSSERPVKAQLEKFNDLLTQNIDEQFNPVVPSARLNRTGSNPEPPSHTHYLDHFVNPIYVPPNSSDSRTLSTLKRSLSADASSSPRVPLPASVSPIQGSADYDRGIGKLKWKTGDLIGRGSGGTLVYKGNFDGHICAVKCLVKACWPKYESEIQKLLFICMERDDLPPSIVRYYGKVRKNPFSLPVFSG